MVSEQATNPKLKERQVLPKRYWVAGLAHLEVPDKLLTFPMVLNR
jgi:hypothetical protein